MKERKSRKGVDRFGSKDKPGNPGVYRIDFLRTVTETVLFFCSGMRGSGWNIFFVAASFRAGGCKLDLYPRSVSLCHDRVCEVQRHARRKVSNSLGKNRNTYAEKTYLWKYESVLPDHAGGQRATENREKRR